MAQRQTRDKLADRDRYELRAGEAMRRSGAVSPCPPELGAGSIPLVWRAPYLLYQQRLSALVAPQDRVLELCSGEGLHTAALVQTGAHVAAIDIAANALRVLGARLRVGPGRRVACAAADMEYLPFCDNTFSVVAVAGGLSYGNPNLVDAEIKRVLRPGGTLLCVDSLNHNPVYRVNRWLHYVRGRRTRSTLQRMPTLARIAALTELFAEAEVRFFGSVSYGMPLVCLVLGAERAAAMSDAIDRAIRVRRSAFKFVLVARGRREG